MIQKTINFIREYYGTNEFIPLHEPFFCEKEKEYLNECIDSTFVSSVGKFVDQFEREIADFTGVKHAVATVNGTSALHIALKLAGVEENSEVITQPLTFVATCNAIKYIGAYPVFVDVDKERLSLSPEKLEDFLKKETSLINGVCINKTSKRIIKAVVPMHSFGIPADIESLKKICDFYKINIVEDAAESLGSYINNKHTGSKGLFGVLSFNGNKTITTGGGGMIITNDSYLAQKAKHLTTTAKIAHRWEFRHDELGYNYRMPNINAALGCAQMQSLRHILRTKRELAENYRDFFKNLGVEFISEPQGTTSNYWLNAIVVKNKTERDKFLECTNDAGVMTRPIWRLMNTLKMFEDCQSGNLENSEWLEERVINIPSSVKK